MRWIRWPMTGLAGLTGVACCGHLLAQTQATPEAALASSVVPSFGVRLGDVIEQRVPLPATLDHRAIALPAPGRVGLRFDRLDASWSVTSDKSASLVIRYQLISLDRETTTAPIPGWTLSPITPADSSLASIQVAGVTVDVAPAVHGAVTLQTLPERLRDDLPLPAIDVAGARARSLQALAALATVLGLWMAWWAWRVWHDRTRLPFAAARWAMQTKRGDPWQLLHQAFDQSAGMTLSPRNLDQWLDRDPAFAGERAAVADFFARSERHFFARQTTDQADPPVADASDPAALQALLERLSRIETQAAR